MYQFKVGGIVSFGRPNGEQTRARIMRVNDKTLSVSTLEDRGNGRGSAAGAKWKVGKTLCTPVASGSGSSTPVPPPVKRDDATIIAEISECYSALSPENLSGDGTFGAAIVAQKRTTRQVQLLALFNEIGRYIDANESFFHDRARQTRVPA